MLQKLQQVQKAGQRRPTESLLGPKEKLCVGAWNVRTMFETSKTAQVAKEMQ